MHEMHKLQSKTHSENEFLLDYQNPETNYDKWQGVGGYYSCENAPHNFAFFKLSMDFLNRLFTLGKDGCTVLQEEN